jgi:hypothetical protein
MVLVALVAGAWLTPAPTPPGRVMAVDFHAHTRFSDGLLSPMEVVLAARRANLDAIAVTEHNVLFPAEIAAAFSRAVGGPLVLRGEEITSRDYHLVAVGIRERLAPRADLRAVIDDIHRQGGAAIAAHPVKRFWPAFEPVRDVLDAAELMHPIAYVSVRGSFRFEDMLVFHERAAADGFHLAPIGSSDFHGFKLLGLARTHVLADEPTEAAIVAALRAGRVAVETHDGRRFGDPEVIAALEERPAHVGYAPNGWLDAVTRGLGWVGVVGLLFTRARRRSFTPA